MKKKENYIKLILCIFYQVFGRPQWITVRSRSRTFVTKIKEDLERKGCQIRISCAVQSVSKFESGKKLL
ncbi:putative arsenite methyltransferase [Helianthus anomalus]